MTCLLIPVKGPVEEITLDGSLSQLQALVGGGYIEALPIPGFIIGSDQTTAYVNEDGKGLGLEPNMRATDFLVPGVGLFFGDYIAGPFLLCGFDPEEGENTNELPASVVVRVRLIEREAGS